MESVPYLALLAYLLGLLVLGVLGMIKGRRATDAEDDYYVASRGQGFVTTSLTIMATYFSGFAMLSFPGWVYRHGIPPMLMALNLPVAACAIYVIGNRVRRVGKRRGYITPADLIAGYYGESSWLRFAVVLVGALYVVPYVVMQVKAGGILAQGLFADVDHVSVFGMTLTMEETGVAALSLVTMIYVVIGGMRSVAWTDVLQGSLLLAAMLLSGVAVMYAFGGVGGYFDGVATLDGTLLTMPSAHGETAGRFHAWQVLSFCTFASLASIVQPAQWMRFYAARDSRTLRRTAVAFGTILPCCFLFGVFLVGLGGRVLLPPNADGSLPEGLSSDDQVVIRVIRDQFPVMFGAAGSVLVALILVAVMAASMSTADSNLHALSAVATRDVYARLRRSASERQRAWFGRFVIVIATCLAVAITFLGAGTSLLDTIAAFFLLAMAYSAQLLPVTVDILFVRRGSRCGAIAGLLAGVLTVTLFPPLGHLLLGADHVLVRGTSWAGSLLDVGLCGVIVNASVFVVVSRFTTPPALADRRAFARDLVP
ncbi:MAG: sodium:solute symporter family protein [Planctomycetes bacterium]|nr:sodium:solute symporter family protein [Planctomycetota bacterium]